MHVAKINYSGRYGIADDNGMILANQKTDCRIEYADFFHSFQKSCNDNSTLIDVEEFSQYKSKADWDFLLWLMVFLSINLVILKIIRFYVFH